MIQFQREYITKEKNISIIVEQALKVLKKRQTLYNRYTRKMDNNDIKVPLEYYITNIASGFFGGKSPIYTIKQETDSKKKAKIKKLFGKVIGKNDNAEEFQIMIDYVRDYNDNGSFFYDLVKDYIITGACYGLNYVTENDEIVYAHTSSRQTVAIYDYSTPVQKIGLLRIWQELDNDGFNCNMVELILNNEKRYYKNSKKQPKEYKECPDEREDVSWLLVPGLAIENPDSLGFYEPVISLIDAFEQIIENNKNIFQYNDEAKLKITGFTPLNLPEIQDPNDTTKKITNPAYIKEIDRIRSMQIFFTPDNTGDIDWLIKNINDTASENHKKTLLELILMTVCIPNVTDVGFTNADNASALEKKFFPLEQVLIQADKQFKKELLSMWENIVDMINTKKGTNFDFRNIDIQLQRNMPAEKKEVIDMAMQLRDVLSDETVIGMLPFDLDVQSEIKKKQDQSDDNLMNNMNKIIKTNNPVDDSDSDEKPNNDKSS